MTATRRKNTQDMWEELRRFEGVLELRFKSIEDRVQQLMLNMEQMGALLFDAQRGWLPQLDQQLREGFGNGLPRLTG